MSKTTVMENRNNNKWQLTISALFEQGYDIFYRKVQLDSIGM